MENQPSLPNFSSSTTSSSTPNSPPPAPPSAASPTNADPSDNITVDASVAAEVNSLVNTLKSSFPFLLLLLLRFLFTYILKIIFLILIYIFHYYFLSELNHQISLKNLLNKQRIYVYFSLSIIFFFVLMKLTSVLFQEELLFRFLYFSYENSQIDFISVLWLTCVTDLSICSLLTSLKLGITLLMTPNSLESRNHSSSVTLLSIPSPSNLSLLLRSVLRFFPLSSGNSNYHRTASSHTTTANETSSSDIDLESGGQLHDVTSHHTSSTEGTEFFQSLLLSYGTPRRRSGSSPTPNNSHSHHQMENSSTLHSPDHPSTRNTEVSSYLRLKRIFSTINLLCAVYRSLIPIPVWFCYFSNGPGADMIPMTYLFIKIINVSYLVRAIVEVIGNTVAGRTEYGRYSTEQEIQRMDSEVCTICFDNFIHPVTLPCRHVFCEHCVFEWLDKENTCPICRAEVREESSTAAYLKDVNLSVPIIM